jgi:hypothetical protein
MRFGGFFRERDLHTSPLAVAAYRALRRGASAAGLHVVLKTFYSPIPELDELPDGALDRVSPLAGVEFDLDAQLAWLERELAATMREFRPPPAGDAPAGVYALGTASYTQLDATVLYGTIRRLRPRRVIELGSGSSTLVIAQALRANAAEGSVARLDVYDPYPGVVTEGLPGLSALHRVRAQDVPVAAFEELRQGDVLFVDTTHTVKLGSDVNFVILDVLPRLAPGVTVHVHDIFLPYEYPRQWLEDFALFWNEQYLLQAFLAGNRDWELLCAVAALTRDRQERFAALLPEGVPAREGSAFWMRRTGPG